MRKACLQTSSSNKVISVVYILIIAHNAIITTLWQINNQKKALTNCYLAEALNYHITCYYYRYIALQCYYFSKKASSALVGLPSSPQALRA